MSGIDNKDKQLSWTSPDGKTLAVRQLKVGELESIYALSKEQLKADMAPISAARAVLEHNSDAIWGVHEMKGSCETLAGFLSFLLLNEEGAALLERGKLDVLHPDVTYLVPTGERPKIVYVWLIVARGLAGVAVPLTTHAMGPLYAGLPLYGTAATESGARGFRNFGFRPVHKDRGDVGNLFVLDRSLSPTSEPIQDAAVASGLKVVVAHTSLEVEHARAIRAAVFMAEQNCPFAEEFDGNDHTATHLVGYMEGEPAATLRLRYFGTFVKIERLAVLKRFRGHSVADEIVNAALEFCGRKGFRKGYGHPQLRLLSFWEQYGFRRIESVAPFVFSDHEYVAVEGDLQVYPTAIAIDSDPYLIVRPEGLWDDPGILERSAERPPTNPHVEGS
ncbi:MAG TPA: GNAT family N-acetyltransferase [Rhizomicrobium sp.]